MNMKTQEIGQTSGDEKIIRTFPRLQEQNIYRTEKRLYEIIKENNK